MSSAFGTLVPSSGFSFFNSGNNSAPQQSKSQKPFGKDRGKKQTNSRNKNFDTMKPQKEQPQSQRRLQKQKPKQALYFTRNEKLDMAAGPLLAIIPPEQLGFQRISHKPRELPKYLIQQIPQLKQKCFEQDPWDKENQKKMLQLERTIPDVTALWETLRKMREVERKIMEEKKLVDKADHAKDLDEAITFQGTCQDMCPIFERARRSVENNVVGYEKDDPNSVRISRSKALKVFSRPAAAAAPPLPSDVRPPHILVKTLNYIVEEIIQYLPDCESFLWDRMRSIRQDFTYQNYSGPEAIDCNERIVRIHLLILHVMAKSGTEYSRQQELEQLHKALITLSEIYDEMRLHGGHCPNEAEFRAYSLLSRIRDPEYDKMIQDLPENIFQDDKVQLAICFRRIISNSNYSERGHIRTENCMNLYSRFFQLIKSPNIPFLMSSFLEVYLNEIRFYAIKSLSHSINRKHKPIPINYLRDTLLFNDDEELRRFCEYYSIGIDNDGVALTSLDHHSHILPDSKPMKQSYLLCVEEKLNSVPLIELINSGSSNLISVGDASVTFPMSESAPNSQALVLSSNELSKTPTPTPPAFGFSNNIVYNPPLKGQAETSKALSPAPYNFPVYANDTNNVAHNVEAKQKINETNEMAETQNNLISNEGLLKNNDDKSNIQKRIEEQKLVQEKKKEEQLERLKFENKKLALQTQIKNEEREREKQIVGTVADKIIQDTAHLCIVKCVSEELKSQNERKKNINELSEELFRAFIHEKLYFIFLESKADSQNNERLKKNAYMRWKNVYATRKKEIEFKKRRIEELAQVGKQLGVPLFKRSRVGSDSPSVGGNLSFALPSTSESPLVYTPTPNEESHFTTSMRKNSEIWKPIDLKKAYLNEITTNLELAQQDASICSEDIETTEKVKKEEIGIFIYSRSWNCISGNWLLSKFGLHDKKRDQSYILGNDRLSVRISSIGSEFSPASFENLQLLVFNSGVTESDIFDLEMKLKQDGEKLIELVHGVALNTNYKFSIVIVYWESAENPLSTEQIVKFLKLDKISRIFSTVISGIEIVKMTSDDPHETLLRGILKIAESFKFELTERGIYNWSLQRKHAAASAPSIYQSAKNIDEKMHKALELEMEKRSYEKSHNNTYAHLRSHVAASPRSRRYKLPVLLSDSHNNKFKTPLALRPFIKKSSSFSVPSAPSHLASKFRPDHYPARLMSLTTPSHSRHPAPDSLMVQNTTPIASVGSRRTANSSGISNVTFGSPFSTPTNTMISKPNEVIGSVLHPPKTVPSSLDESSDKIVSDSVLELRDLIASVKKKLDKH